MDAAGLDDLNAYSLEDASDSISGISGGTSSDSNSNNSRDSSRVPFVAPGVRLPNANAKTHETLQDFHFMISTILHGCGYI
jgi:hypothetical protein